jgi:flagellar biosynthesis protein
MPNDNDPPSPSILKAATLKYDREKTAAPRLTARGRGLVAEKILAIAEEHGIPVHRDADLIEILEKTELDTEIPLEVYAVVAEIFAYVYKVNQQKKV